jgi:uncharacterized membrane protein
MAVFTDEEQQRIQKAVAEAEKNTSGEIRVCVEKTCSDKALDRAARYFARLECIKPSYAMACLFTWPLSTVSSPLLAMPV